MISHVLTTLLLLAATLHSAELLKFTKAESAPALNALFVRTNGWIGADGDYSIAISPQRTLWFFSDTMIGTVIDERRTNVALINNSVGVQTGHGAEAKVEFAHGRQPDGKAAAWLAPADGHGWFWPVGVVLVKDQLHVLLWQMERAGEKDSAFGFRFAGAWLGVIANPHAAPAAWRVTQTKLPFTELTAARHLIFGSAVLRDSGHIYLYGTTEKPRDSLAGKNMIVARVAADSLTDFAAWRFFRDGEWVADFREVTPVARGVANEFSVTPHPAGHGYVAVHSGSFLSPDIVARTAPQPWGPWSEPVVLYRCPEAAWRKDIFCYSAKAHVELAGANELVITYAASSHLPLRVFTDAKLYWPRFVRVTLAAPR